MAVHPLKDRKNRQRDVGNAVREESFSFGLKRTSLPSLAFVLAVTFVSYIPSLSNQFVNWDDYGYVVDNLAIRELSPQNLVRLFTKLEFMGNYHPLTMLSYTLEYHFFGGEPAGYHTVSLLLHIINTGLVFWFMHILSGRIDVAFIVGLLFGVHPIHVESVGWVSERKDLLYTMFFLLSLTCYVGYIKGRVKGRLYILALALFILAILSKAMAVSLGVVLFLVDFSLGRQFNKKLIIEKIPFVLAAIAAGIVALFAQQAATAIHGFEKYSFIERLVLANYGLINYLLKLVIPTHLSAFYPFPGKVDGVLPLTFWMYPLGVVLIAAGVFYSIRLTKKVLFGAVFFLGTIVLVLQVLQVGGAVMADRYAYVPSIGFFYILAEGAAKIRMKVSGRVFQKSLLVLLGGYCLWLSVLSWDRCQVWKDSFSLWDDVLERYPWITFARDNRGYAYYRAGKYEEALRDFNKVLELDPNNAGSYHNRGVLHYHQGKYAEALTDLNRAIELKLENAESYTNRGAAHAGLGNFAAAISDFNKAIELDPDHADAYNNRGAQYAKAGMFEAAISDFSRALALSPDYVDAQRNKELALANSRGQSEPKQDGADSQTAEYFLKRGMQYGQTGNLRAAVNDFNMAISLNQRYVEAYNNRGIAYAMLGQTDSSYADFDIAIRLKPDYADAYYNRGVAKRNNGNKAGACADFTKAVSLNHPGAREAYDRFCK